MGWIRPWSVCSPINEKASISKSSWLLYSHLSVNGPVARHDRVTRSVSVKNNDKLMCAAVVALSLVHSMRSSKIRRVQRYAIIINIEGGVRNVPCRDRERRRFYPSGGTSGRRAGGSIQGLYLDLTWTELNRTRVVNMGLFTLSCSKLEFAKCSSVHVLRTEPLVCEIVIPSAVLWWCSCSVVRKNSQLKTFANVKWFGGLIVT